MNAEVFDENFIDESHIATFKRVLDMADDDDISLKNERLSSQSDWTPVYNHTLTNTQVPDETSWSFNLLRFPLLLATLSWTFSLSIIYLFVRLAVALSEWITLSSDSRRKELVTNMRNSTSYEEYMINARKLDTYLNLDEWKTEDRNKYYDWKTIRRSLNKMKKYRTANRIEDLMVLLQSCVKSNYAGIENPLLYSHTYAGTKVLIEDYNTEVTKSIAFITKSPKVSLREKRIFFRILDKNFGRTCLVLSGGASFCFNHFGVIKALIEHDLMPDILSGTSGGGMIAALAATRTNAELLELITPKIANKIKPFGTESFYEGFKRWWRTGARFDSIEWARQGQWWTMGSTTFKECLLRTGKVLNISTVPHDIHSPTILCNYITSPNCCIWSAMLASAAVPGILNPVILMEKAKENYIKPFSLGSKWKDGSLRTDVPLSTLNVYFNTKFSIVSQVNPHVMLWIFKNRGDIGKPILRSRGPNSKAFRGGFILSYLENLIKLEIIKWLKLVKEFQLFPQLLQSDWSNLFLQKFDGTITLFPKIKFDDYKYILEDPTEERLAKIISNGEHVTWPKLEFIKHRMSIERAIRSGLESCVGNKPKSSDPSNIRNQLLHSIKKKRTLPHPDDLEELRSPDPYDTDSDSNQESEGDHEVYLTDDVDDSNLGFLGIREEESSFTGMSGSEQEVGGSSDLSENEGDKFSRDTSLGSSAMIEADDSNKKVT